MISQYTVIIPNYNGAGIIEQCLQSLSRQQDVVVVDDASVDNSAELVSTNFPWVSVLRREHNGGFSATVNDGIRNTTSDFVVLLNSDVSITPGFPDDLLPLFDDPQVFAVSPRILLPKMDWMDEGCPAPIWHHGILYGAQVQSVAHVAPILYATGCAAIYRRSMLESLGGFDEIYSPFYWEDTDLCYRAWKRGWKSLYSPASTVHHQHAASTSQIRAEFTSRIKARNSLLFMWRNISDVHLLAQNRKWLPLVLAKRAMSRDKAYLRGWADAFGMRAQCVEAKQYEEAYRTLSDGEIFAATGVDIR